jgi:hypothetical protein
MTASAIGIAFEGSIYGGETENWRAQSVAQDIVNVAVAYPALVILALLAFNGSLPAYLGWLGALGYSAYTYTIYAFSVHFGPLFPLYVAVWGISIYALVGGLLSLNIDRVKERFNAQAPVRSTATLLLLIGIAFYLLWLSDVVPAAIQGDTPQALIDAGLPSNPVHVLDLGVFLPLMLAAGLLLWRRRGLGYCLAPPLLVATMLLGLGIIAIQIVLVERGLEEDLAIAGFFGALVAAELTVACRFLRAIDPSRNDPEAL